MKYGDKSVGSNGKENALFPLEYINITQDSFGNYSHMGSWAIDLNRTSGVKDNVYASFSGTIRYIDNVSYAQMALVSDDVVNHADGIVSKCALMLVHSENMPANGTHFNQGDLICQTGNAGNSAGIHLHLEVNHTGAYTYSPNAQGVWCLSGQNDPADSLFKDNTILMNYGEHFWVQSDYVPPAPDPENEDDIDWILTLRYI